MKLAYPAIFTPDPEYGGYTVTFPDLPGCVTQGDTLAEAIFMAEDAASGWILDDFESGIAPPKPSPAESFQLDSGSFVNIIALDMAPTQYVKMLLSPLGSILWQRKTMSTSLASFKTDLKKF